MRTSATLVAVITLALVSSGCATKRYGRLQPVTMAEAQFYSCEAIEVEIAKVEGFRQQVAQGAEFNGASVMGFLGDWGIGNASERNAAERTATERMNELLALRVQKGCARTAAPPVEARADMQLAPTAPAVAPPPAAPQPRVGSRRVKCVTCRY